MYLPEIIRGMLITSRHFYSNLFGFLIKIVLRKKKRPIFTLYYPEEKPNLPPAYRGRPVLVLDVNKTERCVACGLCEIICPAFCIMIQPGETSADKERYPESFTLDMARCVFCGFCEEVCPKEAIVMSSEFELAGYDRQRMLFDKQKLLTPVHQLQDRINYIREIYGRKNY